LSLPDLADQRISLPHLSQGSLDAIDIALADHEDHAQTVIESPIHLCLRNRSRPLDQLKDRRHRPTMPLEPCALPSRQNPWKVARSDRLGVENPVLFYGAHDEPGEVIFSVAIERGHLRCLSADQRAARNATALGDAANDLQRGLGIQPTRSEIVEEKERLRPL